MKGIYMLGPHTFPISVWIGMLLTPIAISVGQILFKLASHNFTEITISSFISLVFDPVFISAVTLYAVATFIWVYVLATVPLSIAYYFMALTFILVPIFSTLFLGEQLSLRNIMGIVLVVSGLVVVNS